MGGVHIKGGGMAAPFMAADSISSAVSSHFFVEQLLDLAPMTSMGFRIPTVGRAKEATF